MGGAYAAGVWGFLQGLSYVTDTFHWPERIAQSATLLLGLPIVLVIAWYHGDERRYVEATREAVRLCPDHPLALENLAHVELFQGRRSAALQSAERSLHSDPRNATVLAMLRDADIRSGELDDAVDRYRKSYPELFGPGAPSVGFVSYDAAIGLALLLQERGDAEGARALLAAAEQTIRTLPRLGNSGYAIADVRIHALRGEKDRALAALRAAERAGWRGSPRRYARDFDATLDPGE